MAPGGRRGGGGMKGPDMSWDDEESTEATPNARKSGPLFPDYYIAVPKPLTASEKASVASLISIRDRIRRGPLYAVVDPTITQSQTKIITNSNKDQPATKTNPRAGFDPFTDQEKYTMKYHRKKRTVPDLGERSGYTLRLFPLELWGVMDPKRRMEEWASLTDEQKANISGTATKTKKRKREAALKYGEDDDDPVTKDRGSGSEASDHDNDNDDDEDDVLSPAQKRKKNQLSKTKAGRAAKQKKGLDAEDDYPDVDQQDEDGEGNAGEDEPQDSEFETDEDDEVGADDYNGEQYFDDGADEVDGGGDDDDGGGVI